MKTATVRDLRTRFPRVRRLLEQEGEVVVTLRGKPIVVLRAWTAGANAAPTPVDYLERLLRRMPRSIGKAARLALDEANRGER